MEDINTPKGLSKTALLNLAEKICEENNIKFPYLKKKENIDTTDHEISILPFSNSND